MATKKELPGDTFTRESIIPLIESEDDLHRLAEKIALAFLSRKPKQAKAALPYIQSYLREIYASSGPLALAAVKRLEPHSRPILDIYLLWSRPVDSSEGLQEPLEDIGTKHDQFARRVSEFFDATLHPPGVPRDCASPESLKSQLSTQFGKAHFAKIIDVVRLKA